MKKRTLVCFLIFTLCVFYTSIPNTVFGQEAETSLAVKVHDKYIDLFQRDDVKALLPEILNGLKTAEIDDIGGTIDLAISLINAGSAATLQAVAQGQGIILTDDHIKLLSDPDVQALLQDGDVKTLLQDPAAIDELAGLLLPPPTPGDGTTPSTDEETTPSTDEETTPSTDEEMTPSTDEEITPSTDDETTPSTDEEITPSTDDEMTPSTDEEITPSTDDEMTPSTDEEITPSTDDETTPSTDDEITPSTDDETTPSTDEEITPPVEVIPPPVTAPMADPIPSIMPTNEVLLGNSRLGGLSHNKISGRRFIAEIFRLATGFPIESLAASGLTQDEFVKMVVEAIAVQVPKGVPFPKNQILNILADDDIQIFAGKLGETDLAQGLDSENFGNAITPLPLDLIYDDRMGDRTDPNRKYLTRDNLSLYVRVPLPAANVGGVTFKSSDGTLQAEGRLVGDPEVLGSEFIRHTFRLEEALAAANLPAWPGVVSEGDSLFERVTLYHSDNGRDGRYTGWDMQPELGPNGIVWEAEIEITQGSSYYYFHVELADELTLEVMDREKLAALAKETFAGNLATIAEVLGATKTHTIREWSMPDPRNLQLTNRGILDALFDDNFRAAMATAVGPVLTEALATLTSGQSFSPQQAQQFTQQLLNALGKHRWKLQNILLRNANKVTRRFEESFDPMLSSVFTIPRVNPEYGSLWVPETQFDNIPDGNYFLGAVVHDVNGNPLDLMQGEFTVDTSAPEADVEISSGANTVGYENDDGVYVATSLESGAATLTITGKPDNPLEVAQAEGYLIYQIIGLNEDGTPYEGDPSLQRPNTWMPLTPEATMLASTIWDQTIAQLVGQKVLPEEIEFGGVTVPTQTLTLNTVLAFLGTPLGLGFLQDNLNPSFEDLGDLLNMHLQLDPDVTQSLVDILGVTVDIVNAVPITYGDNSLMMLAQLGEDVLAGDYGIRAMGIDTLLNISSHTAPTHLRIVDASDPAHHDRASVTFAVVGDCNLDGDMDDLFESGPVGDVTIFNNTTENVVLTVTVDHRSPHPAAVMVQYMDASGMWQNIGNPLDLAGTQTGSTLEIGWNVSDFEALLGGNEMSQVMVRAVATNALQITDANPMPGIINLDAGICPLDPEVVAITMAPVPPTVTNPDSGGRQGTLMLTAYTPSRTSTPIGSVRLAAKGPQDAEWVIENSETAEHIDGQELADLLGDLVNTVIGSDKPVVSVHTTYQKWVATVDTTTLADTITVDSPAARDASKDENQYVVMGYANTNGTEVPPIPGVQAMFSVDNVDDVAPLGPTNVSVTSVEATDSVFEDAGDGSYTVGGLVDKYDDAVSSPMATLTIEPMAERKTYASVRLLTDAEGIVIGDVTETAEGSGVFMITIDVGTLADGETYLENGTYMFHALAFDEFGNEQEDMSETDGSKISVTVTNTRRPVPQILAFAVGDPTQTNPDSGAPQGTIALYGYSPEITSAPTTSLMFEVKRKNDTEWTQVGTASESNPVAAADDAKLAAANVADVADVVGGNVVKSDTYQRWMIEVDTTTLEDSITVDSPGARDASKDDNQYMVRATAIAAADGSETLSADDVTAMFSVDNVDDVAPLGPTNVSVTGVEATDSVFETAEDGSYTVGGLVDKYDDAVSSPVATFTLKPAADRKTYKSVRFVTDIENLVVGDVTETAEGSGIFEVTVDVGTLADSETYLENGTYMFYALAFDEFGNEQADESETDGSKISVTVENSYRPAPEIFAITTDPAAQTKPDSGAPQGILVHNTYTLGERTSPPITSVRVKIKRQDADDSEWKEVAVATEGTVVSEEEYQELKQNDADFIADFVGVAAETVVSGEATAPIHKHQAYQKWSVSIDTVALELEDTITADSPAARDAAQDSNPYIVRAIALSAANESETAAPSGVQSRFSLDNVDDVAPLGPTNITAVTHVAEGVDAQPPIAANEDGSYTVGGIVDESVPSPMIMLTVEPTAEPKTYAAGSVRLVQTDVDGNQITADSEPGVLEAPTVDIGMLENGTYMFHALVIDEFGNVQADDSETDGSRITVHVLNFRTSDISDLAVIAVDGVDVADAPAEPIPLRNSVTVSLMVANSSLAADHLSGAVNGSAVPSESAEDPENTFSLTVMELSALPDGMYTPDGVVTQWNGSVPFSLAMINLDNTGPMITIQTPLEDHTLDSLPTVHATYDDGEGSGTDSTGKEVLAWATTELADGPTVGLVRTLPEQGNQDIPVEQAAIETDATTLVYTRSDQLAGGAYKVTVRVADVLGNVGEATREFAISGTMPMVAIQSPAGGQTVENGRPLISGEFSGAGTVEITTFTVDGADATPEVDGNQFSYTPEADLGGGSHTVVVEVTDGDGKTAQTSATFTVKTDTTPPVISAAAPSGAITGDSWVTISAVVTDEQSSVVSVKFGIDDKPFRSVPLAQIAAGRVEVADSFTAGTHTVRVVAISEGGTTEHSWTFTLVVDNAAPAITSITPSGTFRGGLPVISASATDESGVDKMVITLWDSNGKEVKGKTADDGEDDVEGITRLDFNLEKPLDEGTYTIEVRATDTIGNSATAKGNFSIDFDTAAPVITMASPQNEARLIERRPQISITYADAESGVDVDSIRFVFDDKLINLAPNQKSASQVIYTPPADLAFGQHTVKLEVSDMAHKEGNVSEKNSGARKANMAVHEFTFFVESEEGPVLASRPINAPNPFKDNTRISFTLTRQSTVSIVIYDMTFRPVRVLVDNEVWDAGEYVGKGAIGWDGTTTAGEDLARGVYYCQIIVADGFEPEYAILKLALTR